MKQYFLTALVFILLTASGVAQRPYMDYKILKYVFLPAPGHEMDSTSNWIKISKTDSAVYSDGNRIIMSDSGKTTLWFTKPIPANFRLRCSRQVMFEGQANDRIADMSFFWQAQFDSGQTVMHGPLTERDSSLRSMYEVTIGAYGNTKTLLKSQKKGKSKILREYHSPGKLLAENSPNSKWYRVQIISLNGKTQFWVDGICWFQWTEKEKLGAGYLGFGILHSRQSIADLIIEEISPLQ